MFESSKINSKMFVKSFENIILEKESQVKIAEPFFVLTPWVLFSGVIGQNKTMSFAASGQGVYSQHFTLFIT